MTALSLQTTSKALEQVLVHAAAAPERLAAILDERPEPFLAFGPERLILSANIAAERFFGYGRHELESRSAYDIVPERFRPPNARPPQPTKDVASVEIPGLRKDGTEVPTVWTYGVAPAPTGLIFVTLVSDRAQLIAQLESLRRSDARYRSLLLASASIAWVGSHERTTSSPLPAGPRTNSLRR